MEGSDLWEGKKERKQGEGREESVGCDEGGSVELIEKERNEMDGARRDEGRELVRSSRTKRKLESRTHSKHFRNNLVRSLTLVEPLRIQRVPQLESMVLPRHVLSTILRNGRESSPGERSRSFTFL